MNFNVIAGCTLANFILNLLLVFFLTQNQFELTAQQFLILLIGIVVLVGIFCGIFSERFSHINGFFTGLISSLILILFLAQYVDFNWELNGALITVWSLFGLISAFLGNKFFRKKKKTEDTVEKVETITLSESQD